MIVVFVTFDSDRLERARVRQIASDASAMFEGMPDLRSKVFTFAEGAQRATNVYLWDSEDTARRFFSDQLVERITGLYGVRPRIDFADVVGLVDNSA